MPTFDLFAYDAAAEEQIKADARMSMFLALRSAFRERSINCGLRAKDLAAVLKKDKGHVSRVLNGSNASMNFETLLVYLEALGFVLPLQPVKIEDTIKSNKDARPFISSQAATQAGVAAHYYYSGLHKPSASSVAHASL